MDGRSWAMLALLSLLWGGSFVFGRIAVAEIEPATLTLLRVAIAGAALGGFALAGPGLPRDPRSWRDFAVMSLLNNLVPFTLIFWGQTRIGAGPAAILNATTPVWGVVVAAAFGVERISALKLGGVCLGFAGVAVMSLPVALEGETGPLWAYLACVGAGLSYALSSIWGRRFAATPPLVAASGQLLAGTAMLGAVELLRGGGLPSASPPVWAAVLGLALLSTAAAYLLFFAILRRAGSTNVLLVTLLIPLSAAGLGALVLGEALEPRHLQGMALVLAGLVVIDGRLFRGWGGRNQPDTGDRA